MYNPFDPYGAQNKVQFTPVISDDGYRMGQVKFDGYRDKLQWTALGFDGRRIKDCETYLEAEGLLLDQDVDESELIKEIY